MELKLNEVYSNFELTHIDEIKFLNAKAYIFKRKKTGARVMHIANDDQNRVFFIGFKTPPEDDCGTPHILEHSVLCGSRKYRSKDPFNELAKSSLNTFLNAMTYSDKTLYPIASVNYADFKNLKDVYLDAVFNPLIYEKKEIFMQEGWRYELKEDSSLACNGVVYNEMKGAFSDCERLLDSLITKALFPDTIYDRESGGDPERIPSLTYEKFLDFHKKYYNPSNSYVYFYGDINIEEELEHLEKNYLSSFDKEEATPIIKRAEKYTPNNVITDFYPQSGDDDGTYFSMSFACGTCLDPKLIMGLNILGYILTDTNASPVKKALVDAKIAEETECQYDSSVLEPAFSFVAKKADKNKADEFRKIIADTLKDVAQNGIDKELLQSALNAMEFSMKEEDFGYRPKGLVYGIMAMKSWLHGENPIPTLKRDEIFESIKADAENGYFENLIKKYLINNDHNAFVSIYPKKGLQEEAERKEAEKLSNIRKATNESDIEKIKRENAALKAFQESEDDVSSIPTLAVSDIEKNVSFDKCVKEDGALFTPLKTNGIAYAKLMFDLSAISADLLPYVGLLANVLGKQSTKKYSYESLPNAINLYTGDVTITANVYALENGGFAPKLIIKGKAFERNVEKFFGILDEIIFNTELDNKENLIKIIKAKKLSLENFIINNSHMAAVEKSLSYFSKEAACREILKGSEYYFFLRDIEKKLATDIDEIIAKLREARDAAFTRQNLTVAFACGDSCKADVIKAAQNVSAKLSDAKSETKLIIEPKNLKEGVITGGKVVYNAKAFDYKALGFEYSGKAQVLKSIISLEYLWNKVRVSGGAYGAGCNILLNGSAYFYSYRDPNIKETFDAYDQTAEFLQSFKPTQKDIDKFIIGAVGSLDRPKTTQERFDEAVSSYFLGITKEKKQASRERLLSFAPEDLTYYAELFEKAKHTDNITSFGNESKIKSEKDTFKSVIKLN